MLAVSHPDEKGAHDDFPDSWALAVLAARDRGEVNETETQDRNRVMGRTKNECTFYRSRNRLTAKRRR